MISVLNTTENTPVTCQTLSELVTALSEEERTIYNQIFRSIQIPSNAFKDYCSWSEECYTRNCIFENDKFELILLCWEKGQKTPIHDHGGEECWVKVIEGEFKEVIYTKEESGRLMEIQANISNEGDISYMIDFMGYHSLENSSGKRAMSLHLYAKPIKNCNVFDKNLGKFIPKDLSYCTVSEEL